MREVGWRGKGGLIGGLIGEIGGLIGEIGNTIGDSVIALTISEVPHQKRLIELLDLPQHPDHHSQLYGIIRLILPYVQDRKTPQLLTPQQVVLLRLLNLLVELRVVLGDETQAETVAVEQLGGGCGGGWGGGVRGGWGGG